MKNYWFLMLLLSSLLLVGFVVAQKKTVPIDIRWERVYKLAEKQLPESALKELNMILEQAQVEQNSLEMIKALVYKMRFELERDPDKAAELIGEFELATNNCKDSVVKLFMYSMTAELYHLNYQNNSRNIDRRTPIVGHVPEDVNEWTTNIYVDKITELLDLSVSNPDLLQKTDALQFAELMDVGEDSKDLQPTLFDFLGYRKIELLSSLAQVAHNNAAETNDEIDRTYEELIAFHAKEEHSKALVYAKLQRLIFENKIAVAHNSDEHLLEALLQLQETYKNSEAVVEVLAVLSNYYVEKNSDLKNNDDPNTDKPYNKMAHDICVQGIEQFPNYQRISLLRNTLNQITAKAIQISYPEIVKPAKEYTLTLWSKNVAKLELKIYRVNATAKEYYQYKQNSDYRKKLYSKNTLLHSKVIDVKPHENFERVETEYKFKLDEYGMYEITVAAHNTQQDAYSLATVTVSDMAFMLRMTEAQKGQMYVLDRESGKPQANVKVYSYYQKWNKSSYDLFQFHEGTTDSNGLYTYDTDKRQNRNIFFFEKDNDLFLSSSSNTYFYSNTEVEQTASRLDVFTDRSIYRPGQTLYFKGIAYYANKDVRRVDVGSSYEVILLDVNNKQVLTQKLKTNQFGSFAGEFVLPQDGLNGAYTITVVGKTSMNVWVEEYKRPTFEVKIAKPKAEIRFGDKVEITGHAKAFAGYNVVGAQVNYRVVRTPSRWSWWYSEPDVEIVNGTTETDSEGNFKLEFVPEKTKQAKVSWRGQFYNYKISADVTDTKAETQQGETSIAVGDKSLFVVAKVDQRIAKSDSSAFEIEAVTLNGEKINKMLHYELYRLEELTDFVENYKSDFEPKELEKTLSGQFNTKDKRLVINTKKLKTGQYKLILKTTDSWGNEVKTENSFVLYSQGARRPPIKTYSWIESSNTECEVGEEAVIGFGTSAIDSHVLFEIRQGNKLIDQKWLKISNRIQTFKVPYKESYGAGVTVMFSFMKDEKFLTEQVLVSRSVEQKVLSPKLTVFRDKLLPGEKAEWTISIPETEAANSAAELMASMYDASLDYIRPHQWIFNPSYREPILYTALWSASSFDKRTDHANFKIHHEPINDFVFNQLNWFGFELGQGIYGSRNITIGRKLTRMYEDNVMVANESLMATATSKQELDKPELNTDIVDVQTNKEKLKPIQIRSNFNETAFFYPQLRTDANGNIKFSFTAPESLTSWNVKMLAHTADLFSGYGETKVVTQKDLMVLMNLPRFVRKSDKLMLTANVINLSEKALTANVAFELKNADNEQLIQLAGNEPQTIALKAQETKTVTWELSEFDDYDLLICKVVAQAGDFSDGEQKYLPVLPSKVLITESMPLTIRGNESRTFVFESMMKNASKVKTQNLSIEFAANPTWYAIQALPTLSAPENENALDYFTAYYANSLAGFIANSNPKIAAVFNRWKNVEGSREALLSNLEKNSELKNILLSETPWLMEAQDETEQKRRIALLFDLNMQKNQAQQYLDKLMKLQSADGGFAWFDNMGSNRYVTQEIVLNLARLNKITQAEMSEEYQKAIAAALHYLDNELNRDFETLKRYNKNYRTQNSIGNLQLFYLHARSEYPEIKLDASNRAAFDFYTAQSEKYWTSFSLYGKAMMAIVANRNGNSRLAQNILASLQENALKTDELGMYWAKNKAGYFWNERPVAVQAAMIEAFTEVLPNQSDIDEMKIWLLKQKQTQRWDSPIASLNAIYALIMQGSDWLANEGKVEIKVGNNILETPTLEAGTDYFKQSLDTKTINDETAKVSIKKSDKGIGWGAMYWQYYQNLDQVESVGGALKISKELYVEKITATGETMIPISQTKLKAGDKVITRLVISTDRHLEFVALKDLRASCFEPVDQRSGCEWKENLCYYQTTKDASTQFFFTHLAQGTYVFEYEMWANNAGEFTSGIASVQCQYAPEFVSHSRGERVEVGR